MKILWMTWKDRDHPLAGGAEVINEELAKRLVQDGHTVEFIVGGFAGGEKHTERHGFRITRLGNRVSIYWKTWRFYKRTSPESLESPASPESSSYDIVIDEVNTIPFFARGYAKEPSILFVHQLAREIWFYQMAFPLNLIGYMLEPFYLWLLRASRVITVSQSTKDDLVRYGFSPEKISIISEGIELTPIADVATVQKYPEPTILALGAVRPMKRTLHVVRAYEHVRKTVPTARLLIAGDIESAYGRKVRASVEHSPARDGITMLGKVDSAKRLELLQCSHVLAVTAVREGWGLTVTEAASQGTPAVVYNVPGLRDSVKNGTTGLVVEKNTPEALARGILMLLTDARVYARMQRGAWEMSKDITFEKCYADLLSFLLLSQ